jgi:hypothetical protein
MQRVIQAALVAFVAVFCASAQAGQIFKCTDASGAVSFQATACADGSQQADVVIRNDTATPAPPSKYNPRNVPIVRRTDDVTSNYKLPSFAHGNPAPPPQQAYQPADQVSYECRMSNGEVFYQHQACPASITTGSDRRYNASGQASQLDVVANVTSRQISRDEACDKINRSGAIGREGHGRDQRVSTYDKNLGRDPCR